MILLTVELVLHIHMFLHNHELLLLFLIFLLFSQFLLLFMAEPGCLLPVDSLLLQLILERGLSIVIVDIFRFYLFLDQVVLALLNLLSLFHSGLNLDLSFLSLLVDVLDFLLLVLCEVMHLLLFPNDFA